MSQIHDQLRETLLRYRHLQKVRQHFETMSTRYRDESERLGKISQALKKEEQDVHRLEKGGMRLLFHAVLGNKEQQLEKERQEYLQVALKYNELVESIDLMRYELDILEKKLVRFEEVEKAFLLLMQSREQELIDTDADTGNALLLISRKTDAAHVRLRDIDEAIAAGESALTEVRDMIKDLKNAREWGQWDMHGGGSGWSKHEAIDKARERSVRVKHALLKFQEELRDVYDGARVEIHLDLGNFSRFTDIFFDNLISDWVVQKKIRKALDEVRRVERQTNRTIQQLHEEKPRVEQEIRILQDNREKTILGSVSRS